MPGYDPTCDNDRLEFLGDAVLDYVVAFEYYNNISAYTPASAHWAKLGFQIDVRVTLNLIKFSLACYASRHFLA